MHLIDICLVSLVALVHIGAIVWFLLNTPSKSMRFVPINGLICQVEECPSCEGYHPVIEGQYSWLCACGFAGAVEVRPDLS